MTYKSPVSGSALIPVETEVDGKKVTVYRDTSTGQDFTKEYLKSEGIKDEQRGDVDEEAEAKKAAKKAEADKKKAEAEAKKAGASGPSGPTE